MYRAIWRYQGKAQCVEQFLKLYDSSGEWVQLFIKTELFCETNKIEFFMTVDYWNSKKAYQKFYKSNKKEIDRIKHLSSSILWKIESGKS